MKAGRAVIAVRVFDHYGSGGFGGTAEHMVLAPVERGPNDAPLSLAGPWLYKIERRLKPIVADWASRPQVPGVANPESPTVLWNGMLAPLTWFSFAGVIWYQGEQNVGRADEYRTLFPTMIRAWRAAWREPAMPFLFVQLPNFGDPAHGEPLSPDRARGPSCARRRPPRSSLPTRRWR